MNIPTLNNSGVDCMSSVITNYVLLLSPCVYSVFSELFHVLVLDLTCSNPCRVCSCVEWPIALLLMNTSHIDNLQI